MRWCDDASTQTSVRASGEWLRDTVCVRANVWLGVA